ncbi:unnamed protein product [Rotaria magnacalcarata]|uniref:Uncharacterized protein n=3 Tax=Rotaria magnacalcarata TaxID=392030 RepID=A0A814QKL3_9BILA|nr:unnamed protein product [Rotaria magnacalcarata]CAF4308975.1 unnamed protein product [Rotaria magnacalcarata]CAF4369847.1 unnamed protein product [Rotaria magnacalcarata]CAF5096717.1 unnamed protein product [Rotaria magnacalcarata]
MRSSFILIVVVLLLSTHIDAFRYRSARQLATAPSNIEVGRNNPSEQKNRDDGLHDQSEKAAIPVKSSLLRFP